MRETIQNANGKQFHAVSLSGGKDSRRVCAVHKITDGGLRYAAFHIKLILRHATLLHQLNQTPADGFIQLQVPHLPSL